jgi:high-affinity K+ transport system ATPase subunit B
MSSRLKARPLFDPPIVRQAAIDSFLKLDPRHQVRNPVMFVVEVVSVLTTVLLVQALLGRGEAPAAFILVIAFWLWFTVIFANFAEAMAEGRGKAQAESGVTSRPSGCPNRAAAQTTSWCLDPPCAKMTWCWWRPAITFRVTARP